MMHPRNIFSVPDIYPEKIDLPNKKLHCCNMSIKSYLETPFLDHRIVRADDKISILDIDKLLVDGVGYSVESTHYVFHNAFCCSTLFSRCLNAYTSALVLREPNVLLEQASIWRYMNTLMLPDIDKSFVVSLSQMISTMLARRYLENDVVIIKPTDACNNIMGLLLDCNTNNKCLLMYSELERFLTAIFKVPERLGWIKVRVNELLVDEYKQNGKIRVNPQELSDAQLAALVWVLHMEKFRELLDRIGVSRVRVLDSEDFMLHPVEETLKYLKFLDLAVDEPALEQGISNIMQTHSKANQLNYSYGQRESDYQLNRKKHAGEIAAGVSWANAVFGEDFTCGLNNKFL